MVWVLPESCTQSNLLSLHCQAAILVPTLATQLCEQLTVMVCEERYANSVFVNKIVLIVLFKIGWFTSNNASNNNTTRKEAAYQLNASKGGDKLDNTNTMWNPKEG
jgi:hypothetical protein